MPSLLASIAPRQRVMLGTLPEAISHPEESLLQYYVEEVIPVSTGPPWSQEALENGIQNIPHVSACTPEIVWFIQGEMQRRVKGGFSILLPAADTVRVFL